MTAPDAQLSPAGAPRLLHDFFASAVARRPDGLALDIPPGLRRPQRQLIRYRDLDLISERVAGRLRPFVSGECVAAVYLPRYSPLLFGAQLGALRSGAAFTCIDPVFPEARVGAILEDSEAAALLTDSEGAARLTGLGAWSGQILDIGSCLNPPAPAGTEDSLPPWLTPSTLAYMIYTSGTTGRPKGVMVEHRGIVNLAASDIAEFRLTPEARIAQTSSPSYDSSLEEIWLAYGAAATIVVADDDTVRLGPDFVDWLRDERISVLCPPPTLLRASGCEDPQRELPDLELVYAGGEAMPQDLADRWSIGRRLENGYGPTECAVTALRGRLRAGEPVHIGLPVPGVRAWAVNADLEETAPGEWGELVIGGAGLARGYWNLPELTAQKFIEHPRFGRIFRTGDLVHLAPDGKFICHGRADTQVKIRGYRVELEEIEARLAACNGVLAAACRIQANGSQETLVAFVTPQDPDSPPSAAALQAELAASLPAYMAPARIGILSELPTTAGGKLDRAGLPRIEELSSAGASYAAPQNAAEALLADAFRQALGLNHPVSTGADFFTELGGDSLRAAELITCLRKRDSRTPIAVRDLYEARTVAALARRLGSAELAAPRADAAPAGPAPAGGRPFLATLAQTAVVIGELFWGSAMAYAALFWALPWLARTVGVVPLILLSPVFGFVFVALYAVWTARSAVSTKRRLIGRYQPTRAPAWGRFYVRNWIVERAAHAIPWWLINGTGFQLSILRSLGARIGRRVHIHHGVELRRGGWDLLEIGDDVMIGQEALLGLVELEDGHIVVSPVRLENGVTIETRGVVSGGACMERGSYLAALSSLPHGATVPPDEMWDGVPAARSGDAPPRPEITAGGRDLPPLVSDLLLALANYVAATMPVVIPAWFAALAVWWSEASTGSVADWLTRDVWNWGNLGAAIAALMFSVPATLAADALLSRATGRAAEGVISRWSLAYVRIWLKTELARSAGGRLAGTLVWPVWLRWAGARIGRGCEISTVIDVVPELIDIGHTTFLADGIYLGGPLLHRGAVTLAVTRLGDNTFLGNHVVIGAGQNLAPGILLGICTAADQRIMREGTSWFGHPPFELPKREVVQLDASQTYKPTSIRYLTRVFWEMMRLTLPIPPALAGLLWINSVSTFGGRPLQTALIAAPLATLIAAGQLVLATIAVKWALLGRVKPGQHAFWSCWCGRWDYVYVTWEDWARGPMTGLEGTLLLSWFLRAMGVTLGKRVVLGPGMAQVVDPDMLVIEDGATVSAMFQAHTFEDRVLKIDRIHIRRNAGLGVAAVPLYGADVGAGATVAPGSVIMKHEHLSPGRRYAGAPAHSAPAETGETSR